MTTTTSISVSLGSNTKAVTTKQKIDKLHEEVTSKVDITKGNMINLLLNHAMSDKSEVRNLLLKDALLEKKEFIQSEMKFAKNELSSIDKELSKLR